MAKCIRYLCRFEWHHFKVSNGRPQKDMMNRMIVGNLVHRPVRSLISIVAVALEVTLILLIVGLSLGMLQDTRARTAGIGADVLCCPRALRLSLGCPALPCRSRSEEYCRNCLM